MEIRTSVQKRTKTIVLTILVGIGVFLTVSAARYGYQVWTRARETTEPLAPGKIVPSPFPSPTATPPAESLFEPLVEEEEKLDVLDYSEFVSSFGKNVPKYDYNKNGVVDEEDFEVFKEKYRRSTQ